MSVATFNVRDYYAVVGSAFTEQDAKIIGPELERLATDGAVRAPEIVEAARPADAPLHRYFEWDDAAAAEEYRLDQARKLARSIVVNVINPHSSTPDIREFTVRAFPSVRVGSGAASDPRAAKGYRHLELVLNDQDALDEVCDEAIRKIRAWERTYAGYRTAERFWKRLGPIFEAIDRLEAAD